jgi:hypothetical protein
MSLEQCFDNKLQAILIKMLTAASRFWNFVGLFWILRITAKTAT